MSKRTILLVDDNPADLEYGRRILTRGPLAFDVRTATSGAEALSLLRRSLASEAACPRPDLLLVDLMMPGMNGVELLREVGAEAKLAAIPAALLTGGDAERGFAAACGQGCFACFSKPLDLPLVLLEIERQGLVESVR